MTDNEKEKTIRISNIAYQIGKFADPKIDKQVQYKALTILENMLNKEKP